MIKQIKEYFCPKIPEPTKYVCKKHGVVTTFGLGFNGTIYRMCVKCMAEAFPVEEMK